MHLDVSFVHMSSCSCVYAHRDQRLTAGVFLGHSPPCCLRRRCLSPNLKLTYLPYPSPGIIEAGCHTGI